MMVVTEDIELVGKTGLNPLYGVTLASFPMKMDVALMKRTPFVGSAVFPFKQRVALPLFARTRKRLELYTGTGIEQIYSINSILLYTSYCFLVKKISQYLVISQYFESILS